MTVTSDLSNWMWAGGLTALWLAHAGWAFTKSRKLARTKKARSEELKSGAAHTVLVAYGSQTGLASELAEKTASALTDAGVAARVIALSELDADTLSVARRILFIASTTGEGDAPDNASGFLRRHMGQPMALSHLSYAVLALGDSSYEHYCAFGRALDHWLAASKASPIFERIEVDNGRIEDIHHWQHHLSALTGSTTDHDWAPPAYDPWILAERTLMNLGSPGGEAWHLRFTPKGHIPNWQAGDIAEVVIPVAGDAPDLLREYSIASLPQDGSLELCVRLATLPDGGFGAGSGWMIQTLKMGGEVEMRVRSNPAFRPVAPQSTAILIGNGTGIAGLRAHLKTRTGQAPTWLLYGERTQAHDALFDAELQQMLADKHLTRLDRAWSRDEGDGRYVQHLVSENAREIVRMVEEGATIFVCGSLEGMSQGVHAALEVALGEDMLNGLTDSGHYRRDVY